eukprot:TRINITY_DN16257_c0_g1_i13.p3 TRINITY_DN16257_c0_g1~~TRINITY_DN16257_c0_g1_i13.p3  ORF type:complete len:106 (+),score=10.75 TRINITY_DN16257_c0_g1_i13:282-599(+)
MQRVFDVFDSRIITARLVPGPPRAEVEGLFEMHPLGDNYRRSQHRHFSLSHNHCLCQRPRPLVNGILDGFVKRHGIRPGDGVAFRVPPGVPLPVAASSATGLAFL